MFITFGNFIILHPSVKLTADQELRQVLGWGGRIGGIIPATRGLITIILSVYFFCLSSDTHICIGMHCVRNHPSTLAFSTYIMSTCTVLPEPPASLYIDLQKNRTPAVYCE